MKFTIDLSGVRETSRPYGPVNTSREVFQTLRPIQEIGREVFCVLMMDTQHRIIKQELHSIGGINSSVVHLKKLLRNVLLCDLAVGVILVHNHPSGSIRPSHQDRELTEKIRSGLDILDIKLIDHLIISGRDNQYYSFTDSGDLS